MNINEVKLNKKLKEYNRMERIIEKLKEQREKAKETFIKNCLIRRASPPDSPVPDTGSYLDEIYDLNQAISILQNHGACKEPISNGS